MISFGAFQCCERIFYFCNQKAIIEERKIKLKFLLKWFRFDFFFIVDWLKLSQVGLWKHCGKTFTIILLTSSYSYGIIWGIKMELYLWVARIPMCVRMHGRYISKELMLKVLKECFCIFLSILTDYTGKMNILIVRMQLGIRSVFSCSFGYSFS